MNTEENMSLLEWVTKQIFDLYETFDGMYLTAVFGADTTISLWDVLISLFIAGTIINLITSWDDDATEDGK